MSFTDFSMDATSHNLLGASPPVAFPLANEVLNLAKATFGGMCPKSWGDHRVCGERRTDSPMSFGTCEEKNKQSLPDLKVIILYAEPGGVLTFGKNCKMATWHHATTGYRTEVYSPLVIIIHLLHQFLQNKPRGKKRTYGKVGFISGLSLS